MTKEDLDELWAWFAKRGLFVVKDKAIIEVVTGGENGLGMPPRIRLEAHFLAFRPTENEAARAAAQGFTDGIGAHLVDVDLLAGEERPT